MKKVIYTLAICSIFFACSENKETESTTQDSTTTEATETPVNNVAYYGEKINEEAAIDGTQLKDKMTESDSIQTKLKATIVESCQKKGCWMMVDMGNGQKMRVTFKDYGFFVPKDGSTDGKEVVMEGVVRKEVTSVETLRHFAEDAGKSKEEIEKITEAEEEYTFEATGVIIKS